MKRERWRLVYRMERWLDVPMIALGFAWLVLLVVELTAGLTPELERTSLAIWAIFVLDFTLRLALAPEKLKYVRRNWLTALALVAPALRIARLARLARAARGVRLLKVISSLNRGMRALGRTMRRRGLGYVLALTLVVTLVGSAGMYAFERPVAAGEGLTHFWSALWWTAMIMTTLGSEYWPRTAEGRVLGFLLAVYAVGVFGYITAALASFFVGRDAESGEGGAAGDDALHALRAEIAALRAEIRARGEGEGV
jgi:voltage-gated potassium channel